MRGHRRRTRWSAGSIGPDCWCWSAPPTPTPPDTARSLAGKLFELRILRGDESCATAGAPLLVVSQFTLYARTDKGRRPSWNLAAPGDQAEPLVRELVDELRRRGATVQTGVFGAMMQVASVNDGPFTVIVDV